MLDRALALFDLVPDHDLNIMRLEQDLTDITTRVLTGMRDVLRDVRPDLVMVHGDTTTALSSALAAFYERIPVAHVEAGLRTWDLYSPWPEELNRRLISGIATLHFAPTEQARSNLLKEGVDESRILVTGNTVIDALLHTADLLDRSSELCRQMQAQFSFLNPNRHLILITGHRRENFGEGFDRICQAIQDLASRPDVQIVYPVHLNPKVREPVHRALSKLSNVHLLEPLDYSPFVYLMKRCTLILTDSGGIQEEAPALGKPVLVMRDTTERPEGVHAGTLKLVGTDHGSIVQAASRLLDDARAYESMSAARNPYGDGKASLRIAQTIIERA